MATRIWAGLLLAAALGGGLSSASCGDAERPPTPQTPARASRPTLRIAAMTDPSGYLEPCGCQSRPLGGIDKAAAQLRDLRADGTPTLFVAAGNLFFSASSHNEPALDGAGDEAARQARWQAETLAKIFGQLELAAAVPGPADLRHGAEVLRELAKLSRTRLLGVDAAAESKVAAEDPDEHAKPSAKAAIGSATMLIERDGVRVGVWGLGELPAAAAAEGAADLSESAQALTADLRERGAQVVVGLLQSDARTARRVAGASRGLDVLLLGGPDSAEVPPPERIGTATLVRAAHHGHGLLVIDLFRSGDGAFADVSAWTRAAQKQALERSVADLSARVDGWRRDPAVDRGLLAEQEARLARMRQELQAFDSPARVAGNTLSARFLELGPEVSSDPATRALMDAHDRRLNEHNRTALAHIEPKPVPAGAPGYVGAARCGACHAPALAWWKEHAHGRAYATLERRNKQFSLSCVGCHVTGFNQPGGATAVHNSGLTDVGCESCHGPGGMHVEDADVDADKNVTREVAESVCKQCHNPEHSDRFDYDAYKTMLMAPGHGLPVKSTSGAAQ